ncbi:MAG: hypothetical protein KC713_08090 [Candidatus Omnitrophica bacterium]|nr:hypothetical protein [Candidatus Omnitrophota bacterium]
MMKKKPPIKTFAVLLVSLFTGVWGYQFITNYQTEKEVLKEMVQRLNAESRVGEVLVTGVNYDEKKKKTLTTIKFLEYDVDGNPVEPKYFTFAGNIIQFQALVVRFNDIQLRSADQLSGKSAYIFWKVFMLDGKDTQEFEITPMNHIPKGYKVPGLEDPYEEYVWKQFWDYALNPEAARKENIKNAQIEAPGSMFIPGYLYTIKIEHDGGLRIDASPISPILKGEKIL